MPDAGDTRYVLYRYLIISSVGGGTHKSVGDGTHDNYVPPKKRLYRRGYPMKSHSAADARQNRLQKRVLQALFHRRCPSQSHKRFARGRTRLTTVTSISCRSLTRQLLYLSLEGGGTHDTYVPPKKQLYRCGYRMKSHSAADARQNQL